MLIKEWMSTHVITINTDNSLNDADKLFQTRVISMLPVMKNGSLVGIVTDGDIKKAMPSDATTLDKYEMRSLMAKVKINTVMSKPVETIRVDQTVIEAARIMLEKGISGMPVLQNSYTIHPFLTLKPWSLRF